MEVKKMQADQVDAYAQPLTRLLHLCTDISFAGNITQEFYEEKLKTLRGYLQKDQACLLGAFCGEQLTGFLWAYVLSDPLGEKLHIAYFAVLPEYKRQGVGTRLLQAAQAQARELGLERAELLVSRDNEQALDFYRGHGFQVQRYILQKEFENEEKKRNLQ